MSGGKSLKLGTALEAQRTALSMLSIFQQGRYSPMPFSGPNTEVRRGALTKSRFSIIVSNARPQARRHLLSIRMPEHTYTSSAQTQKKIQQSLAPVCRAHQ